MHKTRSQWARRIGRRLKVFAQQAALGWLVFAPVVPFEWYLDLLEQAAGHEAARRGSGAPQPGPLSPEVVTGAPLTPTELRILKDLETLQP